MNERTSRGLRANFTRLHHREAGIAFSRFGVGLLAGFILMLTINPTDF